MLKDIQDLTTPGIVKGLNTQYNVLSIQKEQSPNMMNVIVNFDGSIEKRLGSNTMNSAKISGNVGAAFNPAGTGTAALITMIGAWWNLNELNGNRSEEFNNLTLGANSGTGYETGVRNQAAYFIASSNQSLSRATSPYLVASDSSFSISAWIYMNSTAGSLGLPIAAKRSSATDAPGNITVDTADVLVLGMNELGSSFVDSSTANKKTVTPNGNVTQLNMPSGISSSTAGFFNGTTDYVVVPDSADWDFGTGDYDVEFYVNFNANQSCYLIDRNNGGVHAFQIRYSDSSGILITEADTNVITYAWTPTLRTWYKIKVSRDSSPSQVTTLYIDDVSKDTYTGAAKNVSDSSDLAIGGTTYFSGWMKNLKIDKAGSTVLEMKFDTLASSPLCPALYFDGSSSLTVADSADWDFGTDDFYIEFYACPSSVSGINYFLDRDDGNEWRVYWNNSDSKFYIDALGNSYASSAFALTANHWVKVKVARVSGTVTFYVDDAPMGTASVSDDITGTDELHIGNTHGAAGPYTGYLREIIIDKNGTQVLYIKGNENNGETSFTDTTGKTVVNPSSATVIKYTEDYRSCIFTDEQGKLPYPKGSAKVDFFCIGEGVGYFDGTNSSLTVPTDGGDFGFGTSDFTEEFFIRWNSIANSCLIDGGYGSNKGVSTFLDSGTSIGVYSNGVSKAAATWTPSTNTWWHLAVVRSGSILRIYRNGTDITTSGGTDSTSITDNNITVGNYSTIWTSSLMDNLRVSKGIPRYVTTFNPPSYPGSNITQFEYSFYVNSSQIAQFDVSSSGLIAEGSVMATSMGALSTATWYNVVSYYHIDSQYLGITVDAIQTTTAPYTLGITSGISDFYLGSYQGNTGATFDGRIDMVGVWNARLISSQLADLYNSGTGNYYQEAFEAYPWACFDFGASSIRWLTCSHGTGVFASSDLGVSWTAIATDRSATYQYLERSKNVLIMTSDAYDEPLYWAGSGGTYSSIIGAYTPHCKYSVNFNGFLILLNSTTAKRSFNYIDENLQLTSTGWLNFDLPSSADDEITCCFILRRYLYVSTRYKIFRVSYVGGNPDWQYVEVKNWGFMPRTAKKVVITNNQPGMGFYYSIGEVVIGMTFDRKIRIFDGSGDQIISNNVEFDNGECEFALDNIAYGGSGPVISFAEVDGNKNVYKLCLAIGKDSTQTTHFLNYDGRSMALYPFSNMNFNCMCMAESANQRYLMAFDRSGWCHMMDSGNLDGNTTPINEYFDSPIIYNKTPSQSSKGYKTDLFFSNTTSGTLYYHDRVDLNNSYSLKRKFAITGSMNKVLHYESIDTPETYNTYQFRITTSAGTENPWILQRYDHFTKGLGIGINSYD